MTTHIDNIQALGEKIVENLNTMGVEAEFSDGALTLADKILDIDTTDYTTLKSILEAAYGKSVIFTKKDQDFNMSITLNTSTTSTQANEIWCHSSEPLKRTSMSNSPYYSDQTVHTTPTATNKAVSSGTKLTIETLRCNTLGAINLRFALKPTSQSAETTIEECVLICLE